VCVGLRVLTLCVLRHAAERAHTSAAAASCVSRLRPGTALAQRAVPVTEPLQEANTGNTNSTHRDWQCLDPSQHQGYNRHRHSHSQCEHRHGATPKQAQGKAKHTAQGAAVPRPPTCSVKNTIMVPVEELHMYQNSISWKKPDTRKVASRARACRASLGLWGWGLGPAVWAGGGGLLIITDSDSEAIRATQTLHTAGSQRHARQAILTSH
jgi:hypothetical protein